MTVYSKLQAARHELVNSGIKKTGHNSYGGWKYYELGDFIPAIHKIFDAIGLCGVVSFGETATLTVYDSEDGSSIQFSTPIVYAENNKGQAIQVLGSTHTYLRRYLWLLAMEIVEADTVDAEKQEEKPVTIRKPEPQVKPPAVIQGKSDGSKDDGEWFMRINAEDGCTTEQWITAVQDAAEVAMELAKSATDVTNIYAKNKAIFTKLKEIDANAHTELVAKFAATKKSFKG
jgi:hypothetical protein